MLLNSWDSYVEIKIESKNEMKFEVDGKIKGDMVIVMTYHCVKHHI